MNQSNNARNYYVIWYMEFFFFWLKLAGIYLVFLILSQICTKNLKLAN